jgi:hypothetical protein
MRIPSSWQPGTDGAFMLVPADNWVRPMMLSWSVPAMTARSEG